MDRREFMVQGIQTGFAMAVMPVTALAITTSGEGISTKSVEIPVGGGSGPMPAYVAMPKGKGPFPTILVVHEIFGVHEYIQDVCRRLARQGYAAVSPYLYFREGDVSRMKDFQEILGKVVSKVDPERVLTDLDATVKWTNDAKISDPARLGITGFCWGGSVVWQYAAHNPRIKAGVAWYGRITPPTLAAGTKLKAPVLGLYGGKDESIPAADVEKMRAAIPKSSQIIVYPDAGHGFHADYRPSYHEKSAKDGWEKALAWFRKNGV